VKGQNDADAAAALAAYVGWTRRNRRQSWRAVATGGTEQECWNALRNYRAASPDRYADSLILPAGKNPNGDSLL
jgi:hypothetical protein